MSLPNKLLSFRNSKKEAILLPLIVVLAIISVILLGLFFSKSDLKKEDEKSKQAKKLTQPNQTKVNGENFVVPPQVLEIEAQDLLKLLESQDLPTVVHVATLSEWQQGHIKGSFFILENELKSTPNLSKDKFNVLVSKDGRDSVIAVSTLLEQGFQRLKTQSLKGGFDAWKKKGYPVEK